MNSSTKSALLRTINRTEVAFQKGSRNKFENRLPVFVSLVRKAHKAGFALTLPSNLEVARKSLASLRKVVSPTA